MRHSFLRASWGVLAAGVLLCAACDFSVTNPGPIEDSQLNTPAAMPGLVNGMSGDLSYALGNFLEDLAVTSGELSHSGNYSVEREYYLGTVTPEDANPDWGDMQRARWVAENGIERMKTVLGDEFNTTPLAIRAYLYAGFANRLLGETSCSAVIDDGPKQSDSVYFQRADSDFTQALQLAQAQGGQDTLASAALAGRASVRAWLGDWTNAAADAQQVPDDFVFNAIFSDNTERENNQVAYETHTRREISVWGTTWATVFGDPRVPWDSVKTSKGAIQTGQDGKTPFFREQKYPDVGAEVPLAKGTEMLLLRAEAALRNNDPTTAMSLINEERATYGLPAESAPDADSTWTILKYERGAVLWLEGRRFWDLRRWNAEGRDTFLDGRTKCVPISANELAANPNL